MAKLALKQSVILQRGEINTLSLLLMFLLSIASFTFGSLYFESKHKNKLLSSEVQKLKNSQVLLMVPDEQAELMANWMAENPHFVSSFVDKAKQGESTILPIGPGAQLLSPQPLNQQPLSQRVSSKLSDLAVEETKHESGSPQQPVKVSPVSEQKKASNNAIVNTEQQARAILTERKITAEVTGHSKEPNTLSNMKTVDDRAKRVSQPAVVLTEAPDGVKLISLPHGGIRVTTREPEK